MESGMTDEELKAMRELVYISKQIAECMALHPEMTAREIAGDASNPEEELARLLRAIDAVGPLVFPAWGHLHPDEVL
jgi:hypothetical protein